MPIQWPMPCTTPGMADCSACEVMSMMPCRAKPVPSVVTNEGRPTVTVRNPFTQPTTRPMSREMMIARMPGTP